MAKRCTGCGMLDSQLLGLNSNGEPYLACCPDNNYKEITAVEWLFEKMTEQGTNPYWDMRFIQAKQMEKEQIINAYDDGSEERHNEPVNGEQYYNETYTQSGTKDI